MAPLSIIGALSALPLALAHMQMSSPSPLRDPHATDRPDEPKDYNILSPLNADGSNFACKGYHLNTPLTTVATYAAGSKQTLRLKGSATHGGGSCQISLSCNRGDDFHVLKSIIGGCPLSDSYNFVIPRDIPSAKKCLLAWTWFNKIGNREMYMNCAVVDITNKRQSKRDSQVSAANALASYPDLFVANLANINSCRIQETTEVIFDNPGKSVDYGKGENASMKPSFNRGQCTGKPSKNAGSKATSSSNSGGGNNGQWSAPAQAPSSSNSNSKTDSNDCEAKNRSGQYYPECQAGYRAPTTQQEQQPAQQQPQQRPQQFQQPQSPKQDAPKRPSKKPNTKVQQELDAYLATLYGRGLSPRDAVHVHDYVYDEDYRHKEEYSASSREHVHSENCKHKTSGYPPNSYYDNEDTDLYSGDHNEYSKHGYGNKSPQYQKDLDYSYKRVAREKRWTSYNKRDGVPVVPKKKYYRGPESEYVQSAPNQAAAIAPSNQAGALKQVSAEAPNQAPKEALDQASTDASNQVSASELEQAPTDASVPGSAQTDSQTSTQVATVKAWNDMTEAEKFDAFLRRMVELSTNMYSLVKYASASTVNLPWYPPASTYDRTPASVDTSTQHDSTVRRLARRGRLATRSPTQVYPGPSVGSISAPGDATDADDGFRAWFPHLVQGLAKRQLVDPVTSKASSEAGDSVGFFDALAASLWKLFGDPFGYYSDNTDSDSDVNSTLPDLDSAPDASDIPIPLGEPVNYGQPDFPDFDIPDLDGHYTFPPTILAPKPPIPQLLPGYEEGPNGPIWVGDGPDPSGAAPSDGPSIIVTLIPLPSSGAEIYPGDDPSLPTISDTCVEPIPQVGFDSCWGGCNHTASEIAAHETYLTEFAKEQEAYKECLQAQNPLGHSSHWHNDDDGETSDGDGEPEDASHRRPRPGWSQPMIPAPDDGNLTAPAPPVTTEAPSDSEQPAAPETDSDAVEFIPYQNKTLGELVSSILENPDLLASPVLPLLDDDAPLAPVLSDSPDGVPATNPLQEAADLAEEGVTVPSEPPVIDPSKVNSVADALPWLLEPGPVLTTSVPPEVGEGGM